MNLFSDSIFFCILCVELFRAPNTRDKYVNKMSRNLTIYSDEVDVTAKYNDSKKKMCSACSECVVIVDDGCEGCTHTCLNP